MPFPTPEDYANKRIRALPYDQNNKPVPALFVPMVDPGDGTILGYLPLRATNNGDGTATLAVDTEIAFDGSVTVNNIKTGSSDGQTTGNKWLRVETDGTLHVLVDDLTTSGLATEAKQDDIIAQLDVTLSTRASEATLATVNVTLGNILTALGALDVNLSTRASESTLSLVKTNLDDVKTKLDTLNAKDFATQTTLAAVKTDLDNIYARLDVATSTRASEATLIQIRDYVDTVETKLQSIIDNTDSLEVNTDELEAKVQSVRDQLDVLLSTRASEATLALIKAKTDNLDVALSTRATEATLATRLSESDFDAKTGSLTETAPATDIASSGLNGRLQRIAQRLTSLIALLPTALVSGRFDINIGSWFGSTTPTVGQKTGAASIPVVLASDQTALQITPITASGSTVTTVSRSSASVTLLATNSSRKGAVIFNDATANLFIKLGATASSSSFTVRVGSQDSYEVPFSYTGIIDGIWASAGAGNANITELT